MPKQTGSWIKKQSKGSDTYSTQKSITVANIFHSDRQKMEKSTNLQIMLSIIELVWDFKGEKMK